MEASTSSHTYLDAHGHLHDRQPLAEFLLRARGNFRRLVPQQEVSKALNLVVCLADYPGAEGFARLRQEIGDSALVDWHILETGEAHSLLLEHGSGDRLWIIAGRQFVSAEKIEVMAIGMHQGLAADLPLASLLRKVIEAQALAVLPWGVGKWWGRRGRLVREALVNNADRVFPGDNGGRPWVWRPGLLAEARRRGLPVLRGSDPLRLTEDRLRNGSFGHCLPATPPVSRPAAWLIEQLPSLLSSSKTIGRPSGIWSFIRNQWALRREAVTP